MEGADRYNVNLSLSKNWEHLQTKFVGTGHPDISRHEWATQMHRDMLAAQAGHYHMLQYASIAENSAPERVRAAMIERMLQPVGPPPEPTIFDE